MRKTFLKIFGILFMVSALVLTQIPALGIRASSSVNKGFMMDGSKLVKYTGTESSVSVPDGVKTIGAEAFAENITLVEVKFPESLETIENGAFSGCTQLHRLDIPEGCKSIENGAFADCDRLEKVSLPASLISMGTSVFAGCDNLYDMKIPTKNEYFLYEDGVIYNKKKSVIYQYLAGYGRTAYDMPNTVEEIKKFAFWGCENLKEVNVSSRIEEIGDYAFSNATGLVNIVLPYSARAIRRKAFEDCANLTYVTIPTSVTTIDETAFDGCYNLHIRADRGSRAEEFYQNLEMTRAANAEYEDSVSQNAVNKHWEKDKNEQNKPSKTTTVPAAANVENYVEWDVDSPGVLGRSKVVSGQAVIIFDSSDSQIQGDENVPSDHLTLDEETVKQSMSDKHTIAYKAFYGDNKIAHVEMPKAVETIDSFAFARSGLQDVVIPHGVKTIRSAAFYHCDNLTNISIPSSVTQIDEDAFTGTAWLNDWFAGDGYSDFLVVGDGILIAYKGDKNHVAIPYGVKQIGAGAFRNHPELVEIYIPETVFEIGEDAFYNCASLKTVSGMEHVVKINDGAFYLCPLKTVCIPKYVREIGVSAFGGTGLTDCVIFLGSGIPQFSYNETRTRLSEKRAPVFDGISVAVVNSSVKPYLLKDTVLDSAIPGFKGIIYNISTDYDLKIATPIASSFSENSTKYPDTIYVYEKPYRVNPSVQVYFGDSDASETVPSLQELMVVDHSKLNKSDVAVSQSGSTADLSGYHFYVSDAGLGTKELTQAIQDHYGTVNDSNSFFMDLSMYDPSDTIPIKYLGKNTMTVTLPVPTDLIGKELCVITLDRNKNPEVLFGSLSVKDNRQYVSFDISHFSPYALYAPEGELKGRITEKWENASGTFGLDDTPDTGDYINIRLILLIGLFALGGFLLLLGFKDRPFIRKR